MGDGQVLEGVGKGRWGVGGVGGRSGAGGDGTGAGARPRGGVLWGLGLVLGPHDDASLRGKNVDL